MSDSTYKKVKEYLVQKGYHAVPDETYDHIDEWLEWYQNDVEKFHHYKLYNGAVMTNQERYKLGMAKTVCEDWANLLLNEKVSIKAGKYSEQLSKILRYNNFSKQGNQLIEKAFALGTGAFVEYKDANGRVIIDYIRADMIYPLSWDNGDITECAFGTSRMLDGKEVIYLQLHRFGKTEDGENDKQYYIENVYIDAKSGKETDTPEDIEELVSTGSTEPLFQIVAPNICNNIDLDSPLEGEWVLTKEEANILRSYGGLEGMIGMIDRNSSNVSVNVQNQNREFDYEKFGRAAADAMITAGIGFKCDEREFARLIKDLIDYV